MNDTDFRKLILNHWKKHGRHDLPWRRTTDPYHILVSEIMLQQTQVDRVIGYYEKFLKTFPTFRALAKASVGDLLRMWQGLGYNRRALLLQKAAQMMVGDQEGSLPGVGPYTAGALMAFAFNKPVPIIETNIRRVYLHHYFADQAGVGDDQLMPIIERTLDLRNPRRWYWALMDYGAALKSQIPNPNRRSRHYAKQSKFEGSLRQVRGAVLRLLTTAPTTIAKIKKLHPEFSDRLEKAIADLIKEGFIHRQGNLLVVQ